MINVNVGNVENTTIGNGWEVFLRFLWDKISSASTDSMIYIHLFLPFLSMLTAMARDSEVAVYVCNLLAANYSIANEELRDDHLATWSNIFGALRDYYERFQNKHGASNGGNQNLSSSEQLDMQYHTERTCEYFLRLIQAVIWHKPLYQFLNKSAWGKDSMRMDSIFFSLLSCKVRPPLKGELMRTIAIMVQHDYHSLTDEVMSTTVWRYIGVSEIIPNMKAETNVTLNRPSRGLGGGRMGGRDNRPYGRLQQGRGMAYGNVVANRLARSGRAGNNALLRNKILWSETADSMRNGAHKIELEEIESGDQAYPQHVVFCIVMSMRWGGPNEDWGSENSHWCAKC